MLRWGTPRRSSNSRLSSAPNSPGAPNGSASPSASPSAPGPSATPPPAQRAPRGNAALETLRSRVRSSSTTASQPAVRVASGSTARSRLGNGTPARVTASNIGTADEVVLDRRTREALQTASAPAAFAPTLPPQTQARSSTPPPYAHHSLDRSPLPNPMALDDRPRVPPPIYLRSSSNQPQSKLGTLTIHVPGWGVALVRPPRPFDLHPLEAGSAAREPPAEDTVLTGAIEVNMRERRRVQAISVGVQSVARLNMGTTRGWEEDGIFERGVEILGDQVLGGGPNSEGIWLEKGSQSFSFSILLPATLATYDYHNYGRVSYIITARVEGVPDTSGRLGSMFKSREIQVQGDIPFLADFQAVIARTDKLAAEQAQSMSRESSANGRSRSGSVSLSPLVNGLQLGGVDPPSSPLASAVDEGGVIAFPGGEIPSGRGLYHRRSSADLGVMNPTLNTPPHIRPSPLRQDTDASSIMSRQSSTDGVSRSEKAGWLIGDICAVRKLKVHANPSPTAGVFQLDIRKEGYVEGLGPWRFSASSDNFTIASVMLVNLAVPSPAPTCTVFFVRILLSQSYALYSPRTPNDRPLKPEAPKNHVVYQVGRPHRHGESVLGHTVESLWRGSEAGGKPGQGPSSGWRTRAVARLPSHEKIRPSTNPGTITPIRVSHELLVRIFYSIEGETVTGRKIKGPGEVRMCQVRLPITVPSCTCGVATLNLPTYECAIGPTSITPDGAEFEAKKLCQCGTSFAELSASAISRRSRDTEEEDRSGQPVAPGSMSGKGAEAVRGSSAGPSGSS